MTAPAAPASPDVAVRAFRAEHDYWDTQWRQHRCTRCRDGGRCRTAADLAQNAEAAGWRWEEATRRLGGMN